MKQTENRKETPKKEKPALKAQTPFKVKTSVKVGFMLDTFHIDTPVP